MTVGADDEREKAAARTPEAGTRRVLEDYLPVGSVVLEPERVDEAPTVRGRWHRFLHQWDNQENVAEPVLWMLLVLCVVVGFIVPFLGNRPAPLPSAVRGELPASAGAGTKDRATGPAPSSRARTVTPTTDPAVTPSPSIIILPSTPSFNSGFNPGTVPPGVTTTDPGPPPGGPAAGVTWHSSVKVDPSGAGLNRISCVSPAFCMAVGPSGSFLWNGDHWSTPGALPTGSPNALSCATPTFCVLGVAGSVSQWNGVTWSSPTVLAPSPAEVASISCTSGSFCMAVTTQSATAWQWNGSSWLPSVIAAHVANDVNSGPVGCSAPTNCVTTIGNMAEHFDGSSWSTGTQVRPAQSLTTITTISCPAPTFCAMAGSGGDISSWNGTSWSFATVDSFNFAPAGSTAWFGGRLSCSDATFCMDVESDGNTIAWDGRSWIVFSGLDKPNQLDTNLLTDVSCTNTSFCMATTGNGRAFEFSPS